MPQTPHPPQFLSASPCPCGALSPRQKALVYADCCGRYVEDFDATPAPDAERLMRSRYSAFVLQRRDYLLATWHASQRPATLDDLGAIPGVGERKLARYGEALLAVVCAHPAERRHAPAA